MRFAPVRRTCAALATALLLATAAAKPVPQQIPGTFALGGDTPKTTATLAASPDRTLAKSGDPGVPMALDVTMTPVGARKPVERYDRELGRDMHVVAIDNALRDLVQAQGEGLDKHGAVESYVRFPRSGFYHVYAIGSPAGLGRQVFRFELRVGTAQGASAPPAAPPLPPPSLDAADGRYAVRLDPFTLQAGQAASLRLHILHDGQPARDLAPYFGASVQATLIRAGDLSYVPVEVAPDLAMHFVPPQPGTYRLWLQFMAEGTVRTAAFTVPVQ